MTAASHDAYTEAAYPLTEAARYLRLPPTTLRSWFLGKPYPPAHGLSYSAPVFNLAQRRPPALSFSNLIEAHVLRSLRTEHGIPLLAVRKALSYAEHKLGIADLLRHEVLRAAGKEVFLARYGELINLSVSGQFAMRTVFDAHLKRVEWRPPLHSPVRLYPFLISAEGAADSKAIIIDPQISFGRPVVGGAFVSTRTIVDRIDAGEDLNDVARDYDLTRNAVEDAVLYERAA